MRKNKGFTLIELLVVVVVILLLVYFFMPKRPPGRMRARTALCMMNQKQMAMAWVLYADDNNDMIVNSQPGNSQTQLSWVDNPTDMSWQAKQEAIQRGVLYQYIDNLEIYHCPSDIRSRNDKEPDKYPYRTYSIANCMNGQDSTEQTIGGTVTTKNINKINNPATKYVFVEAIDPKGYNSDTWAMYLNKPQWLTPLALWHRDGSTLSFADGHAEKQQWEPDKILTDMFENAKIQNTTFFPAEGTPTTTNNPAWQQMKNGWNIKQ